MTSKENEGLESDEDNSFGPPKSTLLKRLESTEYFEGCSDPEKVFGANLSKIMASFALQSNDDINLADLATPKAQNFYPSQSIDSKLDISMNDIPTSKPLGGFPNSPRRRHSSVHFTQSLLSTDYNDSLDPPGFERSRYNSRSYGGEIGSFAVNDLDCIGQEELGVPTSMIGNANRYSISSSKRRVTLDGVEKSPNLSHMEGLIPGTVIESTIEESFSQLDHSQYEFSNHNIHYDHEAAEFSRRGSRRHSSPPRRYNDLVPGEPFVPSLSPKAEGSHMDVNAAPFQPVNGNGWYQKPEVVRQKVLSEHQRQNKSPRRHNMKQQPNVSTHNLEDPLQRYKVTAQRPRVDELAGYVLQFAKDSQGSRMLQQLMDISNNADRKLIIDEVIDHVVDLSCHPFGNYVVQNFLQHASEQQLLLLGEKFLGSTLKISNDNHGCRAIQFALDILPLHVRNNIINEICDNIVAISKNSHGTHVVQKCLGYLATEAIYGSSSGNHENNDVCKAFGVPTTVDLLRKVEEKVYNGFLRLAIHPYSYRLIQFTLADCNEERSPTLKSIMKRVRQNYQALALDQHGNFILQHILDKGNPKQKHDVQEFVCSKVLMLSQHKFGSHLVEKCLTTASQSEVSNVVKQILKPTGDNAHYLTNNVRDESINALLLLSKDPYANFVVQKAYKYAPAALKKNLGAEILKYADILSRYNYGRHILSRVTN